MTNCEGGAATVDYDELLNFATEMGFRLQVCGAEIYRVEESVQRILAAYGAPTGEVFAIPNCLIVSVTDPNGRPLTRIRRIGMHGTDIFRMEALNDLCRKICAEVPPLEASAQRLSAICDNHLTYSFWTRIGAYAMGTSAFALFFGGNWRDALCGGICGIVIGGSLSFMDRLRTNLFFKTFVSGCLSALVALALVSAGLGVHVDTVIIGALMALVPGIAFTNAMRDIIAGDMVTGISKTTEALLIGVSIALGTAVALWVARLLGVS